MSRPIFEFVGYEFERSSLKLSLRYRCSGIDFEEQAVFIGSLTEFDEQVLERAMKYLFAAAGTSYYKTFFAPRFGGTDQLNLSDKDAAFLNNLYLGGLSQYIYENRLDPKSIAKFEATAVKELKPEAEQTFVPQSILLMQSGGKDSLLAAELLRAAGHKFSAWHLSANKNYPDLINDTAERLIRVERQIDMSALQQAAEQGGYNGHVPYSAILAGYALVSAVLFGFDTVLAANESSSDEANVEVDGLSVNHQYSKTYDFETGFHEYVRRNVSPSLGYGSLIRRYGELEVTSMFVERCWPGFGHRFSSCNRANYRQDNDNTKLLWDGTCSKCANAFLLLAPYVEYDELRDIFNGKNLLQDSALRETFRQLMGLSDIKPFECVGTFDELARAYYLAVKRDERYRIEGITPRKTSINRNNRQQSWVGELLKTI